ncbi:MAG: SdrD B-like domain-containing protein, partial [Romboutsia sp.]|uniref:SdrD B-like domain-containing protein n=1 Tax=Romboutsia sp. TaxID=1965302 RepID=UPI003F32D9C7
YSNSYNPKRFSLSNFGQDTIGVDDDWYALAPSSFEDVKSIKIKISNSKLKPGESLMINLNCLAPVGVDSSKVSWNSFAAKASYFNKNNTLSYIIPVEPQKVGVEVLEPSSQTVKIGDFVWEDKNLDGIYDADEEGVNGVLVELYDKNKNFIKRTTTTNNANNRKGYYLFNNLNPDRYFVKFIPPNSYLLTVQNLDGGSTPNISTKFTNIINMNTPGLSNFDIDAGIVKSPDTLERLLILLHGYFLNIDCDNISNSLSSLRDEFILILDLIISSIQTSIKNTTDYGYKSQLSKLIDIINTIKAIMTNLLITDSCDFNFIAQLIFILIEETLLLLKIVYTMEGLDSISTRCKCLNSTAFDILMGSFINTITELEKNITSMNSLLQWSFRNSYKMSLYSPTFMPKNTIIPKPINTQTGFYCGPCKK